MLSDDYIVGLTDGEGSFCVFLRKPAKATWKTRVECHFYVKMREDELPLLQEVKDFFRCGRISFQKEYRQNQRDNYRYQVSNLRDLSTIIIPFFEKNQLYSTARKKDFNLLRQIIILMNSEAHRTPQGLARIQQLKSQMHTWGSAVCGKSARTVGT